MFPRRSGSGVPPIAPLFGRFHAVPCLMLSYRRRTAALPFTEATCIRCLEEAPRPLHAENADAFPRKNPVILCDDCHYPIDIHKETCLFVRQGTFSESPASNGLELIISLRLVSLEKGGHTWQGGLPFSYREEKSRINQGKGPGAERRRARTHRMKNP
jgi:hypothetical protein